MDAETERANLLKTIQELEFVAVDLNLYLDTHPNDTTALEHYNRVTQELKTAVQKYESSCGPLLNFGFSPNTGRRWRWIERPWPWEM